MVWAGGIRAAIILPLSCNRRSKTRVLLGGCCGRFLQFLATGNSQRQGFFGSGGRKQERSGSFSLIRRGRHGRALSWSWLILAAVASSNFWQRLSVRRRRKQNPLDHSSRQTWTSAELVVVEYR